MPYSERLSITKLQSLEHRRLINDLTTCFNIVRGFSSISPTDFFTPTLNLTLRGHPYRLLVPLTKLNIRHNFFTCRIVKVWNSLPTSLVQSNTSKSFKTQISKHNLSKKKFSNHLYLNTLLVLLPICLFLFSIFFNLFF